MQKYISLIIIAATLPGVQSCETNGSDLYGREQSKQMDISTEYRKTVKNENLISLPIDQSDSSKNGDDTPPKDKQHWRIVRDSVK